MVESRTYTATYWVRADNSEEAKMLAEKGETEDESHGSCKDVTNREVVGTPKLAEG